MDVQYASDLHIDHFSDFTTMIVPSAPVLLIAGDICSAWKPMYRDFLEWCSHRWAQVILISGNHEYTCPDGEIHTLKETDMHIRHIAGQFPNVVFLQDGESVRIRGTAVRVVGATLWSAVDPVIHAEIQTKKGDYKHTYTDMPLGFRLTTPMDICAIHALQKATLASAMATHTQDRLILMTHHMPSLSLLEPEYRHDRLHSCYASADDDLFYYSNLEAVICGHSHRAIRVRLPPGVLVFMNARGYNRPDEMGRTTDVYSPTAVLRI
jgi:predicted MPP superfamily phosphohydrolase